VVVGGVARELADESEEGKLEEAGKDEDKSRGREGGCRGIQGVQGAAQEVLSLL
jgi:hypothetical protein